MKRAVIFAMAAAMTLSLAACGNRDNKNQGNNNPGTADNNNAGNREDNAAGNNGNNDGLIGGNGTTNGSTSSNNGTNANSNDGARSRGSVGEGRCQGYDPHHQLPADAGQCPGSGCGRHDGRRLRGALIREPQRRLRDDPQPPLLFAVPVRRTTAQPQRP